MFIGMESPGAHRRARLISDPQHMSHHVRSTSLHPRAPCCRWQHLYPCFKTGITWTPPTPAPCFSPGPLWSQPLPRVLPPPPNPMSPGLPRLRPLLPARLVFVPFPGQVLLPVAPPARPALSLFAAVLLPWPPLLLTSPPVLPLLAPAPGSSVLSPHVPITLSPPTGGPRSVPCALTSMLTSRGSSRATSRWIGFVDRASARARSASEF